MARSFAYVRVSTAGQTTENQVREIEAAGAFAANIMPVIHQIQATGSTTYRAIAAALNARGLRSPRGGEWQPTTVRNIVNRAP